MNKMNKLTFTFLLITFIFSGTAYKSFTANQRKYMFLNEIREGMEGYGLSVFHGEKVSKFKVKILGILKNAMPKRSIILAKCSSKLVNFAGVQQGMSGSPVYINGRLIGAVAYTWSYGLEPIAGIQPINHMLNILKRISTPFMKKLPFRFKPISLYNSDIYERELQNLQNRVNITNLKPVPTPLAVTGFNRFGLTYLKDFFNKLGFNIQAGGVSGQRRNLSNKKTLKPGEAASVEIAGGDASINAIGTVTHKTGNKVLLFGHPVLKRGPINYPLARAYVHHVFASRKLSWKISSATNIIGAAIQDRAPGVVGVIGKKAEMLPIKISVKDRDGKNEFNYRLVKDPVLFQKLFAALIANSLFERTNNNLHGTVKAGIKLKFKDKSNNKVYTVNFDDFFVTTNPKVVVKKIVSLVKPIQFLIYNWYNKVEILSIKTKIETDVNFRVTAIERIRVLKNRVKPGETVKVIVTLKPFRKSPVNKIIKFKIPDNMDEDDLTIFIGSAKVESLSHQRFFKYYYNPDSIAHLVRILNRRNNINDFVLWFDWKAPGLVVNGRILSNLPPSRAFAYGPQNEVGRAVPTKYKRTIKYFSTNYMIHGWGKIKIKIDLD